MDVDTGKSIDDGYEKVGSSNKDIVPPPIGYDVVHSADLARWMGQREALMDAYKFLTTQRPPHSKDLIEKLRGALGIKEGEG